MNTRTRITLAQALEEINNEAADIRIDQKRINKIKRKIKHGISKEGFFDMFKSKNTSKEHVESVPTKTNNHSKEFSETLEQIKQIKEHENQYDTLKSLSKEFSETLQQVKQIKENDLELKLTIPDHLTDIKDYTYSLNILLNSLKSIEQYYKKVPKFLDSVHKLGQKIINTDFVEEKEADKKLHKQTADLILSFFRIKENLLSQPNLTKTKEKNNNNSIESYKLVDRNKVFSITTFDSSLVGETDYGKLTKNLTQYLDFNCSPILEVWFDVESPLNTKDLTVSKQNLIKHIEVNIDIVNVLISIKDMIDTVDPRRGSAIMKKSTDIYDNLIDDIDDVIFQFSEGVPEHLYGIDDFFFNIGSWVEDHHTVKYEERNFNVLIKMLDKN